MPRRIDRRQKPAWQKIRRPFPPPAKQRTIKGRKKTLERTKQRPKS